MAKYEPRLNAPSTTDKNWIHTSYGGYNSCIHIKGGSVLPNCVGYAWGRWRELLGSDPKLSRGDAENWFRNTSDGYERGSTPKVGAVICWRKGSEYSDNDGCGHIAIVEQVKDDGTVVTSNSAYGGTRWYTKEHKPPYNFGNYVFQGIIYLPIEFDEPDKKTVDEIAQEVLAGKWGNGADRKKKLTAAGYDYDEVQNCVNKLLTGKPVGKTVRQLAEEVIAGKWGNGADRKKRLESAGYDYNAVQRAVNNILNGK